MRLVAAVQVCIVDMLRRSGKLICAELKFFWSATNFQAEPSQVPTQSRSLYQPKSRSKIEEERQKMGNTTNVELIAVEKEATLYYIVSLVLQMEEMCRDVHTIFPSKR